MKVRKLMALVLTGAMAASTLLVGTGVSAAESGSERTKITALLRASETSTKYIILKKLLTEFSEEHGLEEPEFELVSGDADYVTKLQLYINSIPFRIFTAVQTVRFPVQHRTLTAW